MEEERIRLKQQVRNLSCNEKIVMVKWEEDKRKGMGKKGVRTEMMDDRRVQLVFNVLLSVPIQRHKDLKPRKQTSLKIIFVYRLN